MSVGHGDEYGSMVYEFAYTEDICIGDYLSFDVSVKDELASSYEIKLILGGEDYVAESKQILLANSDATRFYFDTSIISSLDNVKYLKISARPLSDKDDSFSLALSNMSLYSSTKNSEELEDAVINSRNELRQAQTEVQKGNTLPTKYIIVLLIAVLFMAVVTIIVSRKKTFFN